MAVLQALTASLGPGVWLNTLIALTHAGGCVPASARGPMAWDAYAQQRSHLLQLIVRNASGDARLMNPIAYVESHPACQRNEQVRRAPPCRFAWGRLPCSLQRAPLLSLPAQPSMHRTHTTAPAQGQRVLPSGLPWVQHLLLMVVSAKLLADTEVALQMQSAARAGGAASAAADPMSAMMRPPAGPPVRYLMTQLTQFSQPLPYPDQGNVMDVRSMQATCALVATRISAFSHFVMVSQCAGEARPASRR